LPAKAKYMHKKERKSLLRLRLVGWYLQKIWSQLTNWIIAHFGAAVFWTDQLTIQTQTNILKWVFPSSAGLPGREELQSSFEDDG
jgi:hypothetical protein